MVGQGQIKHVDSEVCAINDFPSTENKKQLMKFYGMAGYCREFCPNFSTISEPPTQLFRKIRSSSGLEKLFLFIHAQLPELLSPLPRDRLSGSSASDVNTSSLSSAEHTHIDEELDQSNQHMNYDKTENSSLSDRVIGQHSVIRKHTDIIMARGGGDVMTTHGGQGSPVNAYNAGGYNNSQRSKNDVYMLIV